MTTPVAQPLVLDARAAEADARPVLADLFGADYSGRAITPQRSDLAPNVVRQALARLKSWDARTKVDLAQWVIADHGDAGARTAPTWEEAYAAIANHALRALAAGRFVVGLGGDHSVSWPIVDAVTVAAKQRHGDGARVGVVQLDIHHDLRNLDSGPSNGTPFRGLLESGVLRGDDLVQVGIHRFANDRALGEFADANFVRVIDLDEFARLGPAEAARSALASMRDVDVLHVSVDIDVLDRAYAPGTAAALPGGLTPSDLASFVEVAATDPRVGSIDIVEFDPERDVASNTALNAALIVQTAVASVARRSTPPT